MQKNIEKLQAEMPLAFELMDKLRSDIAEITGLYAVRVQRLRERTTSERFQSEQLKAYMEMQQMQEPIRRELDAMAKRLADILAFMPQEPFIVPASTTE